MGAVRTELSVKHPDVVIRSWRLARLAPTTRHPRSAAQPREGRAVTTDSELCLEGAVRRVGLASLRIDVARPGVVGGRGGGGCRRLGDADGAGRRLADAGSTAVRVRVFAAEGRATFAVRRSGVWPEPQGLGARERLRPGVAPLVLVVVRAGRGGHVVPAVAVCQTTNDMVRGKGRGSGEGGFCVSRPATHARTSWARCHTYPRLEMPPTCTCHTDRHQRRAAMRHPHHRATGAYTSMQALSPPSTLKIVALLCPAAWSPGPQSGADMLAVRRVPMERPACEPPEFQSLALGQLPE